MLQPLFDYQGNLPECPIWCERTQTLYWTDINRKQLHAYALQTNQHHTFHFEEEVGSFALREQGGFILAMRTGIFLASAEGELLHKVCDNPNDPQLSRFNDGCVDQQGRFYSGTYWERRNGFNAATLVRVNPDLTARVVMCDLLGTNGLAFSEDLSWMYCSDTPNYVIYRTPLSAATGESGLREVFVQLPQEKPNGRPDGAAVDVEGCYWTAMYEGGRLLRFSPDGEQLLEVPLPVPFPTMVCFGGPDMKTLFITTASQKISDEDLQRYPLSGHILTLPVEVAGLPKPRFAG